MSDYLVLGAGMVGVSTALALQAKGHQVILLDRSNPGLETSYGNAGIIQAEAAEPYALPRDPATLLKYAFEGNNDVVWNISAVFNMRTALWRYFRNSAPKNHMRIAKIYSGLTARSTSDHEPLIQASGAEPLISRQGLIMLYRQEKAFLTAAANAERLKNEYGVTSNIMTGENYRRQEPALQKTPAGAVHWLQSWSCADPGALTQAYAKLFQQRGGKIVLGDASTLIQTKQGWQVQSSEGGISADQVIIALGPWSAQLLQSFGYHIPMIYKRGYHGHFESPSHPNIPFLDMENGVLAASMTKGVRLTTGAALVKMNAKSNPKQLVRGTAAMKELLLLGKQVEEPQWFGSRPCLPDMLPLVGAAPNPEHKGLWFNFGHGHQGFTLGPTTAELLVSSIAGENSELLNQLAPNGRF